LNCQGALASTGALSLFAFEVFLQLPQAALIGFAASLPDKRFDVSTANDDAVIGTIKSGTEL
jgi:hypothetical protein